MKHRRIPGILDVFKVSQPDEIRAVSLDARADRQFNSRCPVVNGIVLGKLLAALSYAGRRFPTLSPRGDAQRASDQDALWKRLNATAAVARLGSEDLENLGQWIKRPGTESALGVLVQQTIGRLFVSSYEADVESWEAALTLDGARKKKGVFKTIAWTLTKRVPRAKALLAQKVNGDLAGIHGTGIAIHNIVKGFLLMQGLYVDISQRQQLTPEQVAEQCLFAPPALLRQATSDGEIAGCPFKKGALFLLELSEANKQENTRDLVFLDQSWSRCPADQWVPALFEGVWRRAVAPSHLGQ
jgi:hypothetical protein